MKLLIVTQKVDRNDDVFGFFHRWIEQISGCAESIRVICLQEGAVELPENVKVFSLGKECRQSRVQYVRRFYKHIRQLRQDYDVVFVHMNPVYVLLGSPLWKLWNKKIFLWYNHEYGNMIAKTAVRLVQSVFYTSSFSFAAQFENSKKMPAGIDTAIFESVPTILRQKNMLLYVGRIAAIKKVDVLVEAARRLHQKGVEFVLQVAGVPGVDDESYYQMLRKQSLELEQAGKIRFLGKIPNHQTPELYSAGQILFNLSPPGLFDKTVLEAMACQSLVLVSSPAFKEALPDLCIFKEGDSEDLAAKIEGLLELSDAEKKEFGNQFRNYVLQNHSLEALVQQLEAEFSS
ncbi:MAG: glycosyltransferase family 4 protein [bacterium]|nr:glycosyltransferase family 4 protein [bacterium]